MIISTSHKKNVVKTKELLKKELANLSYTQLCEVFNIIRTDTDKFTENNNGVFINLKFISDTTLKKIWDFIEFSKNTVVENRQSSINNNRPNTYSNSSSDSFTMGKEDIQLELNRIKNIKNENFSFQNFLDRLSSNNLKNFPTDGSDRINYPVLKSVKYKFEGSKARILKKCKDANNNTLESSFTNSLDMYFGDDAGVDRENQVNTIEEYNEIDEDDNESSNELEEDDDFY